MDDKIILVCAIGRSGSTTLQLILNTIPDSNICGENNGALNNLLEFYRQVKFTHNKVERELKEFSDEDKKNINKIFGKGKKPAWFNTFDLDEVKKNIQNTIIAMFKKKETTNVWGFKEIRYDGKLDLLHEFRELFPQTKVIFNLRENQRRQSVSAWFRDDPNALQKIKSQSRVMVNFYKENQDFCYLNTLERMYNKNNIVSLFKFIDCYEHFNEDKVKRILMTTRET